MNPKTENLVFGVVGVVLLYALYKSFMPSAKAGAGAIIGGGYGTSAGSNTSPYSEATDGNFFTRDIIADVLDGFYGGQPKDRNYDTIIRLPNTYW